MVVMMGGVFIVAIAAIYFARNLSWDNLFGGDIWLFSIWLFIGGFIFGIPIAVLADPPLPKVSITSPAKVAIEGVPVPLEGYLVAHIDGFWHLFDEQRNELLSIPDDKVLVARIPREQDTTLMVTQASATPSVIGMQEDVHVTGRRVLATIVDTSVPYSR